MADTFTVEPGANGWRIVNQFGRTVVPAGIPTWDAANEMAQLLGSGRKFHGRALVMEPVRRAQSKDRGEVRLANGKTCNRPIKGVKQPVINSSKPRGY